MVAVSKEAYQDELNTFEWRIPHFQRIDKFLGFIRLEIGGLIIGSLNLIIGFIAMIFCAINFGIKVRKRSDNYATFYDNNVYRRIEIPDGEVKFNLNFRLMFSFKFEPQFQTGQ